MKRKSGKVSQAMIADCLAGGGEMGELMRSYDWSTTPFGNIDKWPQSLRTAISLMLSSRFGMVIAWGPEFRFFYNDRYRPVLGATKHPGALGTPAQTIFPEAWPQIGPLFESTRKGESVGLDDLLIPLDRYGYLENCYFTLSYSPIRDETGGIGGMLAVVAETTEQVQGERRLKTLRDLSRRSSEAKTAMDACANAVQTLTENPIDVPFALIYLISPDGKTARLEAECGIAPDTNASRAQVDLTLPDDFGWPLGAVAGSGNQQVVDDLKTRFGQMPGGPYPEHAHSAILLPLQRPGQPHLDGIVIFGISPRRALDDQYRAFFELAADHILISIRNALAYQEERERAERLAELDRAKTIFFSNVSHEFRTPLTLMLGPLEETLSHAEEFPAVDREQLSLVHRNSLRLLKLVNTLLDFSRIESGRIEAVYEPVELDVCTTELASVFRSTIERAGLRYTVDCPQMPEQFYIDREMWEKIILNLISNAFKFTFEGEIAVRLRWNGSGVDLEISDTGTGISENELPHLFERFHRIRDARARTHEGSGIGLALVYDLVRLHHGTIKVSSKLNVGTVFTISLPAGHAHLPADRIKAKRTMAATAIGAMPFVEEALRWLPDGESGEATGQSSAYHSGSDAELSSLSTQLSGRPRILLADDNADMRDYLRTIMETEYDVETVADGDAALNAAQRQPPDLILSDVMMPKLDGFELLKELRGNPTTQNIPFIMLSARAGEESRLEGFVRGADDYLVKPFSSRELMARVRSHLDLNQMRQEARKQVSTILDSIADGFIALDRQWRLTYINRAADEVLTKLQKAPNELLGRNLWDEFPDLTDSTAYNEFHLAVNDRVPVAFEFYYPALGWFAIHAYPSPDGLSIYFHDITERKRAMEASREYTEILETINRVGQLLVGELDIHKLVQAVTDAATELTGAGFGSFFYNVIDKRGESYMLYTLSGVPREAFAHFPMPRSTDLFGPTFRGEGVVRIADVKKDPRYGKNSPYYGMPKGHLPVTSYLAVPVISRSGEVLGGLFFGHPEPGMFRERDEKVVVGLAGQAAISIDNARLFEAAERDRAQATFLSKASEALSESLDYETTLQNLSRIAVENLCDWCVVDVVNEKGEIVRIASCHKDPSKEPLLAELKEQYTPDWNSPQPSARVLRTGQSELLQDVTDDLLAERARSADHMQLLRDIGLTSHIAVVLTAHGNKLGSISFGISDRTRRFGKNDLRLAEELGRRASFAIENARLYRVAQEANRMKDEFLATVSHELRTPLSAVLGWARVLRTAKMDTDAAQRAL